MTCVCGGGGGGGHPIVTQICPLSVPMLQFFVFVFFCILPCKINVRKYRRGNHDMDKPEKLVTLGTKDTRRRQTKHRQDEEKKTLAIRVGHHYTQKKTTQQQIT